MRKVNSEANSKTNPLSSLTAPLTILQLNIPPSTLWAIKLLTVIQGDLGLLYTLLQYNLGPSCEDNAVIHPGTTTSKKLNSKNQLSINVEAKVDG